MFICVFIADFTDVLSTLRLLVRFGLSSALVVSVPSHNIKIVVVAKE